MSHGWFTVGETGPKVLISIQRTQFFPVIFFSFVLPLGPLQLHNSVNSSHTAKKKKKYIYIYIYIYMIKRSLNLKLNMTVSARSYE